MELVRYSDPHYKLKKQHNCFFFLFRPLFDGFGSQDKHQEEVLKAEDDLSSKTGASSGSEPTPIVQERLPNGWTKKAIKRMSGEDKVFATELNNRQIQIKYTYMSPFMMLE